MKKCFIYLVLLFLGCHKNPVDPAFQKEVSVFGYLWGGHRLSVDHAIMLAWTRPITEYYDLDEAAVKNSQVTITEIQTNRIFILHNTDSRPAYYYNDSLLVQPRHRYLLTVKTADRTVTAETNVPSIPGLTTALSGEIANQVLPTNLGYEKPVQIECDDPDQIVLISMFCNEPFTNAEYINPFSDSNKYPRNQEEYDGGRNAEPRHIQAFMKYQDLSSPQYGGRHVIYWYASMLVFYGSNTLQVLAIDDNYHKYLYLEHPELSGGIHGGIGLFGSVCGQNYNLQVVKSN